MVLNVLRDESGNVVHACAVVSLPLPAGHWIYGEPVQPSVVEGDLPPDFRLKLRDALRYTLQVCTSRGKDDFDPDAVCMTLEVTLFGLEHKGEEMSDRPNYQWRPATKGDIGSIARFRNAGSQIWVYGMLDLILQGHYL